MKFSFTKKIGETEFTFEGEFDTHKDFFRESHFFTSLPTTGPNGETDLELSHRTTKDGHEYFSIVSQAAKKEFKLGQYKDMKSLFPKGWEDLYDAGKESTTTNSNAGLGAPTNLDAPVNNTAAQGLGLGQQVPQPTQQAAPQPAAKANPTANAEINDVLAKYGLGNTNN